jgi:hypothetical protein
MYAAKLGTMVAILATAAGFSAFAGSAQAQISGTIGGDVVDNDALQVNGDPDISLIDGNVAFEWNRGETSAHVTATIHLTHAERASWRLRVQSFDRSGKRIGTAFDDEDGTTVFNEEVKDIDVDMDATSAPYVARVNVAVQMLNAADNWVTKASNETNLNLHDDQVTLLGDGLDVGGPGFGSTGPLTPATISWKIGDDGNMTATYSGVMFHDGLALCGRVVLRSLWMGIQVDELNGPKHCPGDNGFYSDPDTLATAPTSTANGVEVAMQSRNGGWGDLDTARVTIAE